ncbi:Ig-like and fibronectin type-III domain-containing protein 1 [Haliotis rufescens]|uniref:Ig-like and fibronectin type-III domain-containing protein 1 n=1 Tax=Haliotis rufescens TaxID=6454 RepID=UPI00201EA204|nr:Ig-like and fibronectin type-III domain-containing protein 1 [Haliotis rufescens]
MMISATLRMVEIPLLTCIIAAVLTSVSGVPTMLTPPGTVTGTVGGTAILKCQVQDLGEATINWLFVEHNTQISQGRTVLVTMQGKYGFLSPIDNSAARQLNLQITDLKITDAGQYRCYVSGTTSKVAVIQKLQVQGAPYLPKITPEPANFTDCCVQQNVSASCLPACTPGVVSQASLNPLQACPLDLNKLLHCFSDSRNHASCCHRRLIPDICTDFCMNNPPPLTVSHLVCLNMTTDIISCFEEGQVLLPGPPTEVSVLSLPINIILVNWHPTTKNPSVVTNYRVSYKLTSSEVYMSSGLISANATQYTLMGLEGDKEYVIYVTAIGQYGSSQPSERHVTTTSMGTPTTNQSADINACCQNRGVSTYCQVKLCQSSTWRMLNPDSLSQCYSQLDNIFHCLAGGRNHTPCCMSNKVPDVCLGLCSGSPPPLSWNHTHCVLHMHIINACVQQGYSNLPSAPRFVALKSVTSSTAEIEWSAPLGSAVVKNYLVQTKEIGVEADFGHTEEVMQMVVKLTNLKANTEYAARVIAVGETDSSLPSETVVFFTYSVIPPPDTSVATIHNFSACCIDNNVQSSCQPACTYDTRSILDFYGQIDKSIACVGSLKSILTCASDGRDHVNCCKQRYVSDVCHMFCNYTDSSPPLDFSHVTCLAQMDLIIQCYTEGVLYLPKHPVKVEVVNKTKNTVIVAWERAQTGPSVDYYTVAYTPDLLTWTRENVTSTSYILQNLDPGTMYTIEIISVNDNGTSPPSNRVSVYTDTGAVLPPLVINGTVVDGRVIWADKSECCFRNNISSSCTALCTGQANDTYEMCFDDIAIILACASDGRDHRPCCQQIGVPSSCLSFCQGHITGKNFVTAACIAWTNHITGCTLDGARVVPSEPQNMTAELVSSGVIKITWKPAAQNCANNSCRYSVHYWEGDPYRWGGPGSTSKENVQSPYNLRGLETNKFYRVSVSAQNQYGASRLAPPQTVFTNDYGIQDISISVSPDGVVDVGDPVKMFCDVIADPTANITWTKDRKVVGTARRLALRSIKEADSGSYTCTASNRAESKSLTVHLSVRFKPKVVENRDDTVAPKENLTAVISCWFSGFPDVNSIKWKKNNKIFRASLPKVKAYNEVRGHTGITVAQLRIKDVVGGDYGDYICSASNKYGSATGAVKLIDPFAPTRLQPANRVTNVTACCIQKKIDPDCMVACSFDVDIAAIINRPNLFKCLNFLPTFVQCAADGSDHSQCCENEGVAPYCLPFCSGNTPGTGNPLSDPKMLQCIDHSDKIIGCMEENKNNLPDAPVMHAKIKDNNIEVSWDRPTKNGQKVKQYLVHVQEGSVKREPHIVSKNFYTYTVTNIKAYVNYTVWVVASNDFGTSQTSQIRNIYVGGLPPNRPYDLEFVSSTTRLQWKAAKDGPAQSGFVVFFKKETESTYTQIHTNNLNVPFEQQLDLNTDYEAYVKARNPAGYSSVSNTVRFNIGGSADVSPLTKTSGPSGAQVGLGVGLTIVVIAIIIVVLLIVYLKLRQNKNNAAAEAVTFENPSYGRSQIQISGLPAEVMQPSNQFSYGRLDEDYTNTEKVVQMENPYSSLDQDGRPEVNGNNPATLPVTTDEIQIQTPSKTESST